MLARGKEDREIELFFLYSDDAWDRAANIVAMIHNTTRTKESEVKPADEFNQSLKGALAIERERGREMSGKGDGGEWIEVEAAKQRAKEEAAKAAADSHDGIADD